MEFRESDLLEPADARAAAELAHIAFEDFYGLFSSRERILPAIAAQFARQTELNQLVAAYDRDELVGIGAYYDLREMSLRQMEGVRLLLAAADDAAASARALRTYARNFAAPPSAGGYISRFAVAPSRQGTGLANHLLIETESAMARRGLEEVSLHVRRENVRALAFYRKAGYDLRDPGDRGYLLLGKTFG